MPEIPSTNATGILQDLTYSLHLVRRQPRFALLVTMRLIAGRVLLPTDTATSEPVVVVNQAFARRYLGGSPLGAKVPLAASLFGVLSYTVARRSRELAVRSALGARRVDIVRLILRQGMGVTAAGLGLGLLASLGLTRAIATQLYGVTTRDAVTFVAVPLVLIAVAAISCAVPARRDATLDPLKVLRGD